MLRGCLLTLGLLAALIGGYYYWFDQVFEPPGSWIGAGVAGFLVMCGLGALTNAARAWGDWSRVSTARRDVQLIDGRVSAVAGEIHPVGEPLAAPFSGTPCVLCEYDLTSHERVVKSAANDNPNSGSDYAGFLMVPSAIHTPLGDVRLLGFPLIEDFSETRCTSPKAVRNAREFLTTHEFEDRTGMKFVKVLAVFGQIWSDDDGLVQKNMQFSKISVDELFPPHHLQTEPNDQLSRPGGDEASDEEPTPRWSIPKLVEKLVPVGEQVCAIGIYDEMRRGLVPPPGSTKPNRLLRGTADQIEARLRRTIVAQLVAGIIGLAIIHAAIFAVIALYQHSPDVVRDQQQRATQAASQGKPSALDPLVRRGLNINFRDAQGRTLLEFASDAKTAGWLLEHGADIQATDNVGETALTQAARSGRTDIVRQLITAGASLNPRSVTTNLTPFGETLARGHDETAAVLREAGAQE
jgi:hypothetical protein